MLPAKDLHDLYNLMLRPGFERTFRGIPSVYGRSLPGSVLRTYIVSNLFVCRVREQKRDRMITQDIVRKLWDEAGNGNIAIWDDEAMTVVPVDYCGETKGKKPLIILKPIALVNRYEHLAFALNDEELLTKIETAVRAAGGKITRGPRS